MSESNRQFSIDHYSWLISRGLVADTTALGPLAYQEPAELTEQISQELTDWGVVDESGELTPQAHNLFYPISNYSRAWWGTLLLLNKREPLVIEMDQELIDKGVANSLVDTPRVFWQVALFDGRLTASYRAGDNVGVYSSPVAGDVDSAVAKMIFSIIDPHSSTTPAHMSPLLIPVDVLSSMNYRQLQGLDDADVMRKLRSHMAQAGVPAQDINAYSRLESAEKLATTNVLYSPTVGKTNDRSFAIRFHLFKESMQTTVAGIRHNAEGEQCAYYAGASSSVVAGQLRQIENGSPRDE